MKWKHHIWDVFFATSAVMAPVSCISFIELEPLEKIEELDEYLYPFENEVKYVTAELTIVTHGGADLQQAETEIPYLKYNKKWLLTLTQDDCKQGAYSRTWAAINGYPLSSRYYYDFRQLWAEDLPPDSYKLGRTLGSTDGAGNEVRFSFTTTLSPEERWMNAPTTIDRRNQRTFSRFYMKSGLVWDNVREILNYGNSIAFHNVKTTESNSDSLLLHFRIAQDTILSRLEGRGSKMLAEPDGNKQYINAAFSYDPIKIITAQTNANKLIPWSQGQDLDKKVIERKFYNDELLFIQDVQDNLAQPAKSRHAINVGLHGVGNAWIENFTWVNDQFGKDGDDSVWFTSLKEYYEYNYYRHNSIITKKIEGNKLLISITMPMEQYFYFPSITLNVKGLKIKDVARIDSGDQIKGLSYADCVGDNGAKHLMINIDCRKFLDEQAAHFVVRYEKKLSEQYRSDAFYFVRRLKDSEIKNTLLQKIK